MECPKRHLFCYVCALFNPSSHRCNISKSVVEGLERYFMATYVPNVWYTPEFVCERCRRFLVLWNKEGKNASIKFRYVLMSCMNQSFVGIYHLFIHVIYTFYFVDMFFPHSGYHGVNIHLILATFASTLISCLGIALKRAKQLIMPQ